MTLDIPTWECFIDTETRIVFDFTNSKEIIAGETLSSPTITVPSGVTVTDAAVVTAADYSDTGGSVPTGKGVLVEVKIADTATAGNRFEVRCKVEFSGGSEGRRAVILKAK